MMTAAIKRHVTPGMPAVEWTLPCSVLVLQCLQQAQALGCLEAGPLAASIHG